MKEYKKKIKVPRFKEELGFYTSKSRSEHMSKIRAKNTKSEVQFRKMIWSKGYRYRCNWKKLPGAPDIVFNKHKLVVFIDGEFWHGYNWEEKKTRIKANRNFWIPKIERNIQRDKEVTLKLKKLGYTVFRFWEQEIKKHPIECLNKVLNYIES